MENNSILKFKKIKRTLLNKKQFINYYKLLSDSGKVYEWDRGVIGISSNGNVVKQSLDDLSFHHSAATRKVIRLLRGNVEFSISPFETAIAGSKQGILILQFEGDNVLIYFPDSITEEQYKQLIKIIVPRKEFIFSYSYKDILFEEEDMEIVSNFAKGILTTSEEMLVL